MPRSPPKVIPFTYPQQKNVYVGENVTFQCLEIFSGTLPNVRWYHFTHKLNYTKLPILPKIIQSQNLRNQKLFNARLISPNLYTMFTLNLSNHRADSYVYDNTNPSGLRLDLINVNMNDTGAYTCFVSNNEGIDYATFYLKVHENEKKKVEAKTSLEPQ